MKFKIGDKVKITRDIRCYLNGMRGTVIKDCSIVSYCKIVKCSDGCERHVYTHNLILESIKNQQLLFKFMDTT